MADIPGTWLDERLPSNRAEPEAAGAVDVAMIRAALEEAATNPDRSIGGSQYAVLGHYTLPKVLAAYHAEHARAERLAAVAREMVAPQADLLGRSKLDVLAEWLDAIDLRSAEPTSNQAQSDIRGWATEIRAALGGDAPGRGEETGG